MPRKTEVHVRPAYYIKPSVATVSRRPVPNRFDVYEVRPDGSESFICHIGKRDALEQLIRRGVPTPDAERLAYEIGA
jgi:hypothetical protein